MDFIEFVKAVRTLLFNCPKEEDAAKLREKIRKAIDYWENNNMLDKS